ncbi:unnamed protein product [Rangifer tarandus platyrhynchus]|uniref:Uncharacterized protein n=2 Tax=Rangifer tarandus platyrhynchus TaxID=3082113 RepID=A0ABN8YUL6_RANTA|nr:unnamed protein product [Rangifer tarandus platyrhynchus]CAI9702786.1 unnamed protein product [Rangifer tarandus platyrhynchus]
MGSWPTPVNILCFPGSPPSAHEERSRGGIREQPRPPGRRGWRGGRARAAPPLSRPPRRPDGFFHDCIRPRAVFVPAIRGRACELARLSPARRGFSRAQMEHGGAASPPPAEQRPRGTLRSKTHRIVRSVPAAKARGP